MEEIATEKQALFKSGKVLFEPVGETDSSEEELSESLELFTIPPIPSDLVNSIRMSMIEQENRSGWKFFSNIAVEDYALFLSKYLPHNSVYKY